MWGVACFWGQPRPRPNGGGGGGGPSVSQFWDHAYMRAHTMRNNNQILHGDQTRCEEIFYKVDHEC